jgi:hypothetical protein
MRDQRHAEHFGGKFASFFDRPGDFYSTTFAAAAGMDLRFDDNSGCTGSEKFFGRGFGFFAGRSHRATGHGYSILFENRFALILMNFHNDSEIRGRNPIAA